MGTWTPLPKVGRRKKYGPFFTLPDDMGTWTPLPKVGRRKKYGPLRCKSRAHLWKCDWSQKEVHFKCCTSSALPDDMGSAFYSIDLQSGTILYTQNPGTVSSMHSTLRMYRTTQSVLRGQVRATCVTKVFFALHCTVSLLLNLCWHSRKH